MRVSLCATGLVAAAALVACGKSEKRKPSVTLMGSGSDGSAAQPGDATAVIDVSDAAIATPVDAAGPSVPSAVRKLVVAGKTSCVILADASLRCWGENEHGQLGIGTTRDAAAPTRPQDIGAVTDLVLAPTYACALRGDGTVACWGKLGDGAPVRVSPLELPKLAGAARFVGTSCAALADGTVTCWRGPFVKKPGTPVVVPELANAAAIVDDAFVLYADGTTKYLDKTTKQLTPAKLAGIAEIQAHASDEVYCGRVTDGSIRCFGNSLACKLGVADPVMTPTQDGKAQTPFTEEPVTLQLPPARELALDAGENLCAVTSDNQLACIDVGDSTLKRCGRVTTLLESVRTVDNTCALLNDGSVNCWIFDPSRRRNLVAAIAGIAGATQIAVGHSHGCAITTTGVSCWGNNDSGQLGRGAADKTPHPEAAPVAL